MHAQGLTSWISNFFVILIRAKCQFILQLIKLPTVLLILLSSDDDDYYIYIYILRSSSLY